ncbi:hypothetical protein CHS0354_015494 [Potamilus streckersoni]|nr:hypothetical protein CHS0354_015494 [Potamilus streckersoni]
MITITWHHYAAFAVCLVLISIAGRETVASQEIDPDLIDQPNLRLLLNSVRPALLAPPRVYMDKVEPYLQKRTAKRDGFWIWMPAQGYVSVPREEVSGGTSKGSSTSNLLRYG